MANPKLYYNLSDEQLVVLYQSTKDNDVLGVLLQRHMLLMLGIAMKYVKDKDRAKDMIQQVILKCLSSFPSESIQNLKGWLYIVVKNQCLNELKQRNYSVTNLESIDFADDATVSRMHWISIEQNRQLVENALVELGEYQALCVRLFYIEDKSYKDIMASTGLSYEQVKSNIQNGKRNLKLMLQDKINHAYD
jgi:RNA polymerase sigma factor (sigma-70 family)